MYVTTFAVIYTIYILFTTFSIHTVVYNTAFESRIVILLYTVVDSQKCWFLLPKTEMILEKNNYVCVKWHLNVFVHEEHSSGRYCDTVNHEFHDLDR